MFSKIHREKLEIFLYFSGITLISILGIRELENANLLIQEPSILVSGGNHVPADPVYISSPITQQVIFPSKHITGITINVATYTKRNLEGTGTFQILNAVGLSIVKKTFSLNELIDNNLYTFRFASIKVDQTTPYKIVLSSDRDTWQNSFTLWVNSKASIVGFQLSQGGTLKNGDIEFQSIGY